MAIQNDGPFTQTAGEALEPDRLVKLTASGVVYCDAGEVPDGISDNRAANGERVTVRPLRGGLERVTAGGGITAYSVIYTDADGKVSDTVSGSAIGKTVEVCSADGAIITAQIYRP